MQTGYYASCCFSEESVMRIDSFTFPAQSNSHRSPLTIHLRCTKATECRVFQRSRGGLVARKQPLQANPNHSQFSKVTTRYPLSIYLSIQPLYNLEYRDAIIHLQKTTLDLEEYNSPQLICTTQIFLPIASWTMCHQCVRYITGRRRMAGKVAAEQGCQWQICVMKQSLSLCTY